MAPAGAQAVEPGMLVASGNLPATLDPRHIVDVPMKGWALNTYASLYREEGNPLVMQP